MTSGIPRSAALLALALSVAGCATRERYENHLQSWVGSSISTVIGSWGYPSGSFEDPVSGNLVYVWDRQSASTTAPMYQTTVFPGRYGGYATTMSFPGQTTVYRCQTYFEVDKSKNILRWRTQGNDCRM